MASVDVGEAERISERMVRARKQRAQKGTSKQGPIPFGWQANKIDLDEGEAELVREAARKLLDGMSLHAIARDWDERGFTTKRGNRWTYDSVRKVLKNPRLVGEQVYRGEVLLDAAGSPVRGEWTPLLDRTTYDAVQVVLAQNTTGERAGAKRYLLSGILRCGLCGERMYGQAQRRTYGSTHAYTCSAREAGDRVSITGPPTDAAVTQIMVARLAQIDLEAPKPAEPEGSARLDSIDKLKAELMQAWRDELLPGAVVFPQIKELEEERTELRRAQQAAAAQTYHGKLDTGSFTDKTVEQQRAVIAHHVESIVVDKAVRLGEPFNPARLRPVWKA